MSIPFRYNPESLSLYEYEIGDTCPKCSKNLHVSKVVEHCTSSACDKPFVRCCCEPRTVCLIECIRCLENENQIRNEIFKMIKEDDLSLRIEMKYARTELENLREELKSKNDIIIESCADYLNVAKNKQLNSLDYLDETIHAFGLMPKRLEYVPKSLKKYCSNCYKYETRDTWCSDSCSLCIECGKKNSEHVKELYVSMNPNPSTKEQCFELLPICMCESRFLWKKVLHRKHCLSCSDMIDIKAPFFLFIDSIKYCKNCDPSDSFCRFVWSTELNGWILKRVKIFTNGKWYVWVSPNGKYKDEVLRYLNDNHLQWVLPLTQGLFSDLSNREK